MDTDTRLELLETRNTLLDLIARYSHGFDGHEPELLREIFFDDAVLDLDVFGRYEGLGAIMAVAAEFWTGAPYMHHWMANPLLEIDLQAGTASARTALNCMCTYVDSGPAHIGGRYDDLFKRVDGRWAISERTLIVNFVTPLPGWKVEQGTETVAPAEYVATRASA